MNQNSSEKAYLLDLSGIASALEASKNHFDIKDGYIPQDQVQKQFLDTLSQAHLHENLGEITFDGEPFEIEDQSIKAKGIATEDYVKYEEYLKTLYGADDVKVNNTGRPFTLYLAINNNTVNNFKSKGSPCEYYSTDKEEVVNGFYIDADIFLVKGMEDKFHIAGALCEKGKFVLFFLPKDENYQLSSSEDFFQIAHEIIASDFKLVRGEMGIDYPLIKDLEMTPDLSFLKEMFGLGLKVRGPVTIEEIKQKNKFNLNEFGAQFESTTSGAFLPRTKTKASDRLTLNRSFFCLMYSHQGKAMNISYIPGHLFLKPAN